MQTKSVGLFRLLFVVSVVAAVLQGCQKDLGTSKQEGNQGAASAMGKKRKNDPPPPPPPAFYFSDCSYPVYAATFVKDVPVNFTLTKNYINSPGGNYAAFTSSTVNGITFSAPAGTLNVGNGAVTFTASGTPVNTGYYAVSIAVGSMIPCTIYFMVANAPANPATCGGDPGTAIGSTGCVTFQYRGQTVTYTTVRAGDGKIWLQQNLGSPQVAFHHQDQASYGDYFQWGRWDDGHQLRNSAVVTGGSTMMNPAQIAPGLPHFISGSSASTQWWGMGGLATDTWTGNPVSSTNGKDPCVALGAGWRMPTAQDWQTVKMYEDLEGAMAAFQSRLKLPASGYRLSYGGAVFHNGDNGQYWSSTAAAGNLAKSLVFDDNTYSATIVNGYRGDGYPCRCVKD